MTAGLPWGETRPEQAIEAAYRRERWAAAYRRWAAIDQLMTRATPIPWTDAPQLDPAVPPCDDWAEVLVQAAAFAHVRASSGCRGYTTWSSGRVGCGCCGWRMTARMGDVDTAGSARFSQAALARVGQAIALAVDELVQALFEAVLPCPDHCENL